MMIDFERHATLEQKLEAGLGGSAQRAIEGANAAQHTRFGRKRARSQSAL